MKAISEILFTISNGLMIPVVLLLLYLLGRAIWILAGLYRTVVLHRHMSTVLNEIVSNYSYELLQTTLSSLQVTKNNIINEYLTRIMNHKDDSDIVCH